MAVSSEDGNCLAGVIKGEDILEWLKNHKLFMKGTAS
jgi:hypothetical protein